ncbi:GNAT family N-acetyltransferase [Pseudochrobactrum asaccharolyticum]|uniref:RimJ/RimL family protein N-acetyltransferase n=1 Tax=Pseudochrobactrum asaccharolyticum TaxID=354351 RepID=A0A366DXV6_9HYPH|nr:GNAT family N-acetyltransferase [Pseudochrobactrum asaccharolyticum]RBO94912.1 RimJ/RimL family protein N-acetyltransferase [Pseudochrobactrum asaccharolyticum]
MSTIIETPRLLLRNWQEEDRAFFHEINSDPEVMEFFPALRSREESDALMDRIVAMITEDSFGFYALQDKATGDVVGFTGLMRTDLEPFMPKGVLEIGWRLAKRYWGKGYVTEAALASLAYAFNERGQDEVVSFAVHNNHRSTSVMQRIGMVNDPKRDFDHPKVPDSHPQLKRHVLYTISKQQWLNQHGKSGA